MFEPEFDGLASIGDPTSMLSAPSSSDLGLTLVSLLDQQTAGTLFTPQVSIVVPQQHQTCV